MSGLFNLPPRSSKGADSAVVKKAATRAKAAGITIRGGSGGLLERISTMTAHVNQHLSKYADECIVIRDESELHDYITHAIKEGYLAIDTETNSLDPITCTLAGVCLYAKGKKAAYIPIHHVSYVTGIEVDNQLSEEVVASELQRLGNTKLIFHNAKFDIRVIRNQLKVFLTPYWDTQIGARLLNENEPSNLKYLHNKYCAPEKGPVMNYEKLFEGLPFTHVPISTGYLYAARDPKMTMDLFDFQSQYLIESEPECLARGLTRVAQVFRNIEMPLITVLADMEDAGMALDFDFAEKLSVKYHKKLNEKEQAFYKVCGMYQKEIDAYKRANPAHKLSDPILISSPTQIAILLYDIIKVKSPNPKNPRGTGEDILSRIDNPLCSAILEYREVAKLLSTYIDKMPQVVNPRTNRVHCTFNQCGADTGRTSSSDPNMQNIPSHNKEIRKMFCASEGNVLVSCDFSQQEPRTLAHMSQDHNLITAYREGKDIYAWIGSLVFNVPYEECKEFRPDGTKNPEGKKRRDQMKAVVLGIMYGRSAPSIAEQLKISNKEAQGIIDAFFKAFPDVKAFIDNTIEQARCTGFVETAWGRKRRLPDMQLPDFELSLIGGKPLNFDPLFDEEAEESEPKIDEYTYQKWMRMLRNCRSYKDLEALKGRAKAEGIHVKDNRGFIAEASRQCVNSIIQGSSADMTKRAMILVGNDARLKELGYKLLLNVHDELIGECPLENAKEVAARVSELMTKSADIISVPMKCDAEVSKCWYGEAIPV